MPRGDPVHGVGVVGHIDAPTRQLLPKSYRPRSSGQRGLGQCCDSLGKLSRRHDERLPEPLPRRRVERGEHLTSASIEDSQGKCLSGHLAQPSSHGIEGADTGRPKAEARAQPPRGGDRDPYSGEGAGPEPGGDRPDLLPSPDRGRRTLDLSKQRGGVTRAAVSGGPDQGLVQHLAAACRADRRVCRRRVEADNRKRCSAAVLSQGR